MEGHGLACRRANLHHLKSWEKRTKTLIILLLLIVIYRWWILNALQAAHGRVSSVLQVDMQMIRELLKIRSPFAWNSSGIDALNIARVSFTILSENFMLIKWSIFQSLWCQNWAQVVSFNSSLWRKTNLTDQILFYLHKVLYVLMLRI